jgi:hypothetical protein
MVASEEILKGVVRGKTIVLEQEPGLPDGQEVAVVVLPPGEGIRQSAGVWADAGEELDRWLKETQRNRQLDRPGIS